MYDESLPDLVQSSGEYRVNFNPGAAISCPFVVAQSPDLQAGSFRADLSLHVHSLAELVEFQLFHERVMDFDEYRRGISGAPGLPFELNAPQALKAAKRLPVSKGMYLAAELEHSANTEPPLIVRLDAIGPDGRASCELFWIGKAPALPAGRRLWRQMREECVDPESVPFRNGQTTRNGATLIATVL